MALFPQIFILIVIIDFLAIRYIRFSVYIYYILNIRFIYFFFYSFLSNSISSYRCTNFDFKLLVNSVLTQIVAVVVVDYVVIGIGKSIQSTNWRLYVSNKISECVSTNSNGNAFNRIWIYGSLRFFPTFFLLQI